jgi:hypothetical protein
MNNIYFKVAIYAAVVLDWIAFFKFMGHFQNFELSLKSLLNISAMIFIYSNLNSVQFAVAH